MAVLDVAFASEGGGASFDKTTLPFIKGLGSRLAAWVDHHDHERHADYVGDPRFILTTKAQHGACPELVTPEVVRAAGPVDTVAMHLDLDGLYSGAKWVLGGVEPYEGADADARAVDTRRGPARARSRSRIDRALRARFRDETLKHRVIQYLVARTKAPVLWEEIERRRALIDPLLDESRRLADGFRDRRTASPTSRRRGKPYDKTELLLLGQERAPVAVVRDSGSLTIAADFESGFDFVKMFDLGGGMPTRVTVPEARHERGHDQAGGRDRAPSAVGVTSGMAAQAPAPPPAASRSRRARRAGAVRGGRAARRAGRRGAAAVAARHPRAGRRAAGGAVPRVAPHGHRRRAACANTSRRRSRRWSRTWSGRSTRAAPPAPSANQADGCRKRAAAITAQAAGGAARRARAAGQGRAGGLRLRSGGQRHRRDRRLLPGPVRDRDLPGRAPAARAWAPRWCRAC